MRRIIAATVLIIGISTWGESGSLLAKNPDNVQNPQNSDILAGKYTLAPLEDDSVSDGWRNLINKLLAAQKLLPNGNPDPNSRPELGLPSMKLEFDCDPQKKPHPDFNCTDKPDDLLNLAGPLIIHLANWEKNDDATYTLQKSTWYVYRTTWSNSDNKRYLGLSRIISKSTGQPMLYGSKSAWLLVIHHFDKSIAADNFAATYKVSAVPAKAQNVQDFGALAAALLGASLPTSQAEEAGFVDSSQTFVASKRINGLAQLPFDFSVAIAINGLTAPSTPSPLPDATPSANYRQRLSRSKMNNPKFTITEGALPDGLALSDEGVIYGIPSKNAGSETFRVRADYTTKGEHPSPAYSLKQFSIKVASSGGGGNKGGADPPAQDTSAKGNSKASGNTSQSATTSNAAVDCTSISTVAPGCTFSHTVHSLDREWWDFSLSVPIPGVREPKYSSSNPAAPPSSTRHTDLYAMLDLYPASTWATKDSAVPHFVVGLPVTGQTFYRPFFGLGENVTGWTGLQRVGFPLGMSVFFGVVDMRQEYAARNPNTATGQPALILKPERVWKGMFGVELSVSSLASKIGGKSKTGSSTKTGGGS